MNKVKYLAAVLIAGLGLQQAQATAISGNINFAGTVRFDTNNLATATRGGRLDQSPYGRR